MVKEYQTTEEIISLGEEKGLLKISENKVEYVSIRKTYKITDPEELVRASYYTELITKYKYPKARIDLEVVVPRREPKDKADIIVYEDDENKKPYIVVECKKDGISQSEIRQAIEQAFGNTNSLGAKYAILVAGNIRIAFDVANFPPMEREKNIIADIPIRYGKVIKFKYKKGDSDWDLKEVSRDELLNKFQQCHDTLWEGGKRNPAEAFDEMSKLMFCKIHDERFLTTKGNYYAFQVGTHETINEVAERVMKIYNDAQSIDPDVFIDPIKAEYPIIHSIIEILQGISLSKTDLDAKGIAFEHFLGAVFRGEMGQYFTPRTIVEFMVQFLDPNIHDLVIDPACGSGGFLIYTLDRVKKDLEAGLEPQDARDRWKDFALKQVYGIEINSQLARVSMMNMIIHEDGHTNIENYDSLDFPEKWRRQKIREYFGKKFSLLLTNPPFGASVKEREKAYFSKYNLGSKTKKRNRQNTEVIFIERCLDFLKPGGRMGIVLPDGILTNSTLRYVRDFITKRARILGVVSLPQIAFTHYGSGVKASLLFLEKNSITSKKPYPIFISIAEHIGYDAIGRPDTNEFPKILEDYKDFSEGERKLSSNSFIVMSNELKGRLDCFYYKKEFKALIEKLEKSKYPVHELGDFIVNIRYGASIKNIYVEKGIPLLRILNLKPNWLDLTDVVQLPEEKRREIGKCFVKEHDLPISRSGTIGVVAVVPKEAEEFAFGSYMISFRIDKKKVDPYFVSLVMNSDLIQGQIQRERIGALQGNITIPSIKSIKIPVPSLSTQKEIVKNYYNSKRKSNELRKKAEKIETEAVQNIEKVIIRENGG